MNTKNICPYCGRASMDFVGAEDVGAGPEFRGRCKFCGSIGPRSASPLGAIHLACHPAHLSTYDPETQIVISKEMAKWLYEKLEWEPIDDENDMTDPANIAFAELSAALEEK